ncbi:MAG: zinc ribbon domain-containing protein, partial [Solirubrobacterales bacterium]|nr:zinc ribbon domain-containing protein [Solirubrobacterales bacterium]
MPIYEFECEECGARFEELLAAGAMAIPCPQCGSSRTRRLLSAVSPPGRQ